MKRRSRIMYSPTRLSGARFHCGSHLHLLLAGVLAFLCSSVRAQVADDSTGVSVAIIAYQVGWTGTGTQNLSLSVTGLQGTQSTDLIQSPTTTTPQIMTRLAVGKTYPVTVNANGVKAATLQAVPPPGYVMEIEHIAREGYALKASQSVVNIRVRPRGRPVPERAGVATALATERTLWQVSLGTLSNGESAGAIAFIDVGAGSNISSIFSPNGLVYDPPSSEVQVTYNPSTVASPYVPGTIRQILAPQVCVDVYMGGAEVRSGDRLQTIRGDGLHIGSGYGVYSERIVVFEGV